MCLGLYGRISRTVEDGAATETHVTDIVVVDLEKLEQCGRQGKGWYVSIVYVNATPWQAVRSSACKLITDTDKSTCSECSGLSRNNSSFRGAVWRTKGKAAGSGNVGRARPAKKKKHKHMSRNELVEDLNRANRLAAKTQKQLWAARVAVRSRLVKEKLAGRQIWTSMRDRLASGNLRGVVSALKHMRKMEDTSTAYEPEGTTKKTCPLKTAQAVATDILVAVCRKLEGKSNKGNRLSACTKSLLTVVRHQGGEVGMHLWTRNLLIGSERTAGRAVFRPRVPFMARLMDTDFQFIAHVYSTVKASLGITTTCPVEVAEDETAVQAKAEWDPPSNEVVGKCGALCASKCGTIATCRKVNMCADPHGCVATGDYSHTIQDGDEAAFEKVSKWHEESRTGTQARLMVVNPMDARLPQLPILFVPTCLTFTAEYVADQWRLLRQLYDQHLLPVLGPLVSEGASDGASTRRAHHVRHATGPLEAGRELFTLQAPGFVYHGTASVGDRGQFTTILMRKDQDYIHAAKKLINPTDINSRVLEVGAYIISLNMLEIVQRYCHHNEHGLRATDTARSGFDSMDVPSIWRLLSPKVATCISRCIEGFGPNHHLDAGCAPQTQLKGLQAYLKVVARYAEIFMSRKLKHIERVKSAGMVVTFLRLWRLWVQHTNEKSLKIHYISNESVTDATLSCHFAVLWLKMFRELYPDQAPLLYRTGTDVCEHWFSFLGGFVQNKRVYSILEGLQTIRTKLNSEIAYANGIVRPEHKRRVAGEWVELPEDDERNGSQVEYPSDDEMTRAWVAGADEARSLCEGLGMKPTTARVPSWWTHPHDHVPKPGSGRDDSGDSEEVIVARELEEDNASENDVDSSGSENDDDDNAMDEAGQAIEFAVDLVMDAEAEGEENRQLQRPKITATMTVPSVGVVHKQKVMMWLNGAVRTLSADRNKRVQTTMITELSQRDQLHKLSEHDWWIGPGDDVAVLFEKNRSVGKMFHVGRVVKMRRGKVQCRSRVLIHEDRANLEGLRLFLHWYSPCEVARGQQQLVYKFNATDTNPVDIESVICPCALVYNADNSTYTMQATTYSVNPFVYILY